MCMYSSEDSRILRCFSSARAGACSRYYPNRTSPDHGTPPSLTRYAPMQLKGLLCYDRQKLAVRLYHAYRRKLQITISFAVSIVIRPYLSQHYSRQSITTSMRHQFFLYIFVLQMRYCVLLKENSSNTYTNTKRCLIHKTN